jgi:hypothetical protein
MDCLCSTLSLFNFMEFALSSGPEAMEPRWRSFLWSGMFIINILLWCSAPTPWKMTISGLQLFILEMGRMGPTSNSHTAIQSIQYRHLTIWHLLAIWSTWLVEGVSIVWYEILFPSTFVVFCVGIVCVVARWLPKQPTLSHRIVATDYSQSPCEDSRIGRTTSCGKPGSTLQLLILSGGALSLVAAHIHSSFASLFRVIPADYYLESSIDTPIPLWWWIPTLILLLRWWKLWLFGHA